MGEIKNKKTLILIAAITVFAIISFWSVGTECQNLTTATEKKQGQSIDQGQKNPNQNEALFIGCNGFF